MFGVFRSNKDSKLHRFISYMDERTKNLLEWTKYFHHKHESHEKRFDEIEKKLALIPSEHEVRELIDMHYLNHDVRHRLNTLHARVNHFGIHHQHIPDRVKQLHEKLRDLEQKHSLLHEKHTRLNDMHEELKVKQAQKSVIIKQAPIEQKSHFKEKILLNLAKNSKNYVKNNILNIMNKYGSINGAKIKEMIVEEEKLCSKSSFYRILAEIEKEYDNLTVVREGKDKIYSTQSVLAKH